MPTIVKEYQSKKAPNGEQLPAIDSNPKRNRILTEESEAEYYENERIANIKKNWLDQGEKTSSINQIKAKQNMNRTRISILI